MRATRICAWVPAVTLLVLCLCLPGLLSAAPTTATCYHCVLVNNSFYECQGGFPSGAISCSVSGTSCTLTGICPVQPQQPGVDAAISADLVREVARVHPRLAASLWKLASQGTIEASSEIHWLAGPMTAKDVDRLISGKKLPLPVNAGEIAYKVSVVQSMDEATATLVISPLSRGDNGPDANFSYFVLDLKTRRADQAAQPSARKVYEPTAWSLF